MTQSASKHETALDSREGQLARVYAEALLHAAQKAGKGDSLLEQLESLVFDLFETQPQFQAFLSSSAIKRNQKEKLIRKVLESRADPMFFDFLLILNAHDRLGLLPSIRAAYREFRDKHARRMRVKVRSALALTADEQKRLEAQLRGAFQLEPVLDVRVDENLLGGMVVQVGDWVFDGSVKTRLERLRNQLRVRGNYEIQGRRDRFCTD